MEQKEIVGKSDEQDDSMLEWRYNCQEANELRSALIALTLCILKTERSIKRAFKKLNENW